MAKQTVTLQVRNEDRLRLQQTPPANKIIFIANRLTKGLDEIVLLELLQTFYPAIKMLSFDVQKADFKKHDAFIIKKSLRGIHKIVQTTQAGSFALSLYFNTFYMHEPFYQFQLNQLFKTLRDEKWVIVPVHLSDEGATASDLEKMLLQVKKKFTPQYAPQISVRVGLPISTSTLSTFERSNDLRRFVQSRLFALAKNVENIAALFRRWLPKNSNQATEPIINPIDTKLLQSEIQTLRENHNTVVVQSHFEVFVAASWQIPNIMQEIGRLRELTFRKVGEGTGRACDVDEFDLYYRQLIIWDTVAACVVGGYRIGCGDEIFSTHGASGFYVSSLFRIKKGFYPILTQSLELGRSYIIEAYQGKYLPLFLLWKGILTFLLSNPHYRYLFGPVSISRRYSDVSRSIMVEFLRKYYFNQSLSTFLTPRKPFKLKISNVDVKFLVNTFGRELNDLDQFIEGIEVEQTKMPILVKQYVRQNAKFIGFNVDPNFSDCLDGFIILDLKDLPISTINNLQKEKNITT